MNAPTVVDAYVSMPNAASDGPISGPMVAALEGAWSAIRERHPEVPAAVIVLGAGSIGAAGGLKPGHFAAMRWSDPDRAADEGSMSHGCGCRRCSWVGGEGPGPWPGRRNWHASARGRFKALAEELGIEVGKDHPCIGWSPTSIPSATRDLYGEVIAELGRSLRLRRSVEITDGGRTRNPGLPSCVCECGRKIKVPRPSSRGADHLRGMRDRLRAQSVPPAGQRGRAQGRERRSCPYAGHCGMITGMAINDWWSGEVSERFWMETTGRDDLGVDLHAPQLNGAGRPEWGYALVAETQPGDVVLHWHKSLIGRPAMVGWSVVTGPLSVDEDYSWMPLGSRGGLVACRRSGSAGVYRAAASTLLISRSTGRPSHLASHS